MSEVTPQPAPRIAIKFGSTSSKGPQPSSNGTRQTKAQPSSLLGKRPRPNALNADSDEDDDDDEGKHVAVRSVGADARDEDGGSKSSSTKKERSKYIIKSQGNRDWKSDALSRRAHKIPRSNGARLADRTVEVEPADQDKNIKWGLTVTKKSEGGAPPAAEDEAEPTSQESSHKAQSSATKDDDKDAMDALLGRKPTAQDLVINGSAWSGEQTMFSETDSYKRGLQEAADVSTIEEYGEIPEGEFGAAMLRGMGWKGEDFGTKPKEVKRRPHLMGLGSKEDEEIKKAEQAKKHGHRERRPRLDEYRRDREKEKQERDGRHRDSYKSERERERREHGERHRDRDRDRDRDYHRHRDSRRHR